MGGHIQKTGGRWRIDYRDGQGRRHRATFDTRKEADNALTDIKSRIGKGEYVASKLLPKFRELAEDWFRFKGRSSSRNGRQLARSDRSPPESEIGRSSPRSDRRRADRKAARRTSRKIERQKRERRVDHGCGNLQAGSSA